MHGFRLLFLLAYTILCVLDSFFLRNWKKRALYKNAVEFATDNSKELVRQHEVAERGGVSVERKNVLERSGTREPGQHEVAAGPLSRIISIDVTWEASLVILLGRNLGILCVYITSNKSMATTVTWVQNGNQEYEISSAEHLKQLMHQGTLYTDAGTPPSDYWGSSTNYIQTADIDLLNDSTDIKPIGIFSDLFEGSYDGGEYSISNYSYLDPNFSTANSCERYVGLFGYPQSSYIKNIRLNGVWTIEGFDEIAGFLAGFIASTSFGVISNIEGNFSTGSFINTNQKASDLYVASLIGRAWIIELTSVTVRGSIDFMQDTTKTVYIGGIVGYLSLNANNASVSMIRNLATFPSGIGGRYAGGIISYCFVNNSQGVSFTNVINCMIGDIFSDYSSSQYAGGIIGRLLVQDQNTSYATNIINSMTGDIYATSSDSYIGGLMGYYKYGYGTVPSERLLNYMTGNIYVPVNSSSYVGGIIGYGQLLDVTYGDTGTLSNCINAMNGNVTGDALFGTIGARSPTPTNTITNTNFGLTFTENAFNTGTPTGLLTNSEFTDLPYVDLTGTDTDGNPHDFEFVYGNLSGNSSYSDYTHLVLHRGDIYTPYEVTYGIPSNNTTVYLTYVNIQTTIVTPPEGLTIVLSSRLDMTPRATNLPVSFVGVAGATGYNVTIEGPTGGEVTVLSGVTELEHNITGLDPETQYTVRLYADTGTGYALEEEATTTTLANVASSYDITDFEDVNGATDLTSLDTATLSNISSVLTELVSAGDIVNVAVGGSDVATTFVDSAGVVTLSEVDGILLPFESTSGAGQTVTLTLSDTTTVPVTYDEVSGTISVESVSYDDGDVIYLDGNKLEVSDFYGLTVVSVNVAPLIVVPGPINIPVTITEVPGAVGYKISYVGSDGKEITSTTGTTTLEHSITGLVPETEYTIKLYADTGTGFQLTEELPATTLANVAANYDANQFVEDGVINLGSLPENTIANVNEVMNELFTTGDMVNVSISSKEKLTSFVNLGDTLSIDQIENILLPFESSSGSGQDANITLSDGTTTVGINYDESANTITVNGTIYYPGDSFIMDGKKVTVVEY